jgi:site-specific recombinase XerD
MIGPARVLVVGPLAPFGDGFYARLIEEGYAPGSAEAHLRLLAHVSRWLAAEGLGVVNLTPAAASEFVRARRGEGYVTKISKRGLRLLLDYLGGLGVLPVGGDRASTPVEQLVGDYRAYLLGERGLAAGSVRLYEGVARLFLSGLSEPIRDDLACLSGAEITAFIARESGRRGVASAKTVVCALRSLLRFLYVEGWTVRSLVPAVPAVASRRQGSLPQALDAEQVALLLRSCDLDTALGGRDFAILTVLARLGLRAGEVAALELGDVDWRSGAIVIRGKGPRLERLPLPSDVGGAVADYLRRGRPSGGCRQLFLRSCAPRVGITKGGITDVVRNACLRAGIPPVGAHRLRHTVATELLRRGAALPEIGQVLRHKSLRTTAIYAKVDRLALSALALPWPGAEA